MISFKGRHHQRDIILQCVRWYVAYSLSYRDLEELMQERGYAVDHSTVQRWVMHYAPPIEKTFRKNNSRAGHRWRLEETYIKIKGEWKYLYRAVDKSGANTAGIKQFNIDEKKRIKIRQCKYLNNVVEQDHRFIKRIVRPMLGFKSFRSAQATLAGIEFWRMLKKGQGKSSLPAWEQFYALSAAG
jgi:transposase-like protein